MAEETAHTHYFTDIAKILLANSVLLGSASMMLVLLVNLINFLCRIVGRKPWREVRTRKNPINNNNNNCNIYDNNTDRKGRKASQKKDHSEGGKASQRKNYSEGGKSSSVKMPPCTPDILDMNIHR